MNRVNLQFDEFEFQRLQTIAREKGLRAGTYARAAVLEKVKSDIGPSVETETRDMFNKFFKKTKTKRGKK